MVELNTEEVESVNGALGWTDGGVAVNGLGLSGGPATGAFGLTIGAAMLVIEYYAD